MDGIYQRIYERIWFAIRRGNYRRSYWRSGFSNNINEQSWRITLSAVEGALERFDGPTMRDDAKLFLTTNIQLLVVLPQLIRAREKPSVGMSDYGNIEARLLDQSQRDAEKVIHAASRERRGEEISSASVVRGLAKVLDTLSLKDAHIWSSSEEEPNNEFRGSE